MFSLVHGKTALSFAVLLFKLLVLRLDILQMLRKKKRNKGRTHQMLML